MRYPKSIADDIEQIETTVALWPRDIEISVDDVIKWALQFDAQDFSIASRVVRNLNVMGQRDLDRGLQIAFTKLVRKAVEKNSKIAENNTMYAAMGEVGKSGAMIGYHLRMNSSISEENFLSSETLHFIEEGRVENIVLLDDVIGTGGQATEAIDKLAQSVTALGVKNIFVLSVCGMKEALDKIQEETKAFTFSAFEYSRADTAASLDSSFYNGIPHEERETLKRRLEDYGRICVKRNPLGYGDLAGLLVLPYNTPNFTLPIVWSANNQWIPLFRRIHRVSGIAAYYSKFTRAADEKASLKANSSSKDEQQSVTLFVEGKRDEIFFDELIKRVDLSSSLGSKDIRIVSLGANVVSDRLVNLLSKTNPRSAFIVEDDHPGAAKLHERLEKSSPVIKLTPSFFQLLDVKRILEDFPFEQSKLEALSDPNVPDVIIAQEVERILLRVGNFERSLRLIQTLVDRYLDADKVQSFIERLRSALVSPRPQGSKAGG
jgi:hypothetical protein